MRCGEPEERAHDPPYGAEESDKRAGRASSGQERGPILELGQLDIGLPSHRTRNILDSTKIGRKSAFRADRLAFRTGQLEDFLISRPEHLRDRAVIEPHTRGVNGVEILGFPEDCDEAFGLPPGARNLNDLVEDDAPARDREPDQRPEHDRDNWARAQNDLRHTQLPRRIRLREHSTADQQSSDYYMGIDATKTRRLSGPEIPAREFR